MTRRRGVDAETHIVNQAGDRKSRCGVKDPLPVVLAEFVQRHIDGHQLVVCEKCAVAGWPGRRCDLAG